LGGVFERSSFSSVERQIILLAASAENNCNYCAAAHSAIAKSLLTPPEVIAAVHDNAPVPHAKLNALVSLVRELVRERGCESEDHSEVHFRGVQKGAGDGNSSRHRPENDQQLSRPHFPNTT